MKNPNHTQGLRYKDVWAVTCERLPIPGQDSAQLTPWSSMAVKLQSRELAESSLP